MCTCGVGRASTMSDFYEFRRLHPEATQVWSVKYSPFDVMAHSLCIKCPLAHVLWPIQAIWNEGLDLAIAFFLSLVCFWKALRGVFLQGVPPQLAHVFPLTLFLYVMYRAVTPWDKRKIMYTSIWEVLEAPWGRTAFKEGFVGDVLTSTVRVMVDLTFSIFYFLSGVKGWCVLCLARLLFSLLSYIEANPRLTCELPLPPISVGL